MIAGSAWLKKILGAAVAAHAPSATAATAPAAASPGLPADNSNVVFF